MKFKIVFVLITLVFVSCGKSSDKTENIETTSKLSANDAKDVIVYNNVMVDYLGEASKMIKKASEDYININGIVNRNEKPTLFTGMAFAGSKPDVKNRQDGISLLEPVNGLPNEIREQLISNIKGAAEAFENTNIAYVGFKDYLQNEDYINDNWAKGKEYMSNIENNIMAFYNKSSECYNALKPIAEDAELKLLEGHPLKESIVATKKDLTLAEEIINIIYSEQKDMQALSARYTQLEKNYNNHKNLTPDKLKEHKKYLQYNNFYEDIKSFLNEVKKSKEDGKINDNEAELIGKEYKSLVSFYNSFV